MGTIEQYEMFVEIIERGSLTGAAKQLRCSLQSASRALMALEGELGVELIRRTTRRMQPTSAGELFYRRIKSALAEIDDARLEARSASERVSGIFRVGASILFASRYVAPTATSLLQRFPGLEIELVLNDSIADLIEERLDMAVRIGELNSSSLKARLLTRLRRVIVASPSYLAQYGIPCTPADLADHRCVVRTFGPEGDSWPLTLGGTTTRIAVHGAFRSNDAASANAAVLLGAGLGLVPLWQVRDEVDHGRLELVLNDYEPSPIPVHAVWPGNTATPARTKLLVDALVTRLAGDRI